MTDQELIRLLREKSAANLSSDEIAMIQSRWRNSAEFRQACDNVAGLVENLSTTSVSGANANCQIQRHVTANAVLRLLAVTRPFWLVALTLTISTAIGLLTWNRVLAPRIPIADRTSADESDRQGGLDDRTSTSSADEITSSADELARSTPGTAASSAIEGADAAANDPSLKPTAENPQSRVDGPWSAGLAPDAQVWSSDSPRWTADFRQSGHDEFPEAIARSWLKAVEPDLIGWSTELIGKPARRVTRFQGIGKLRAPWPSDAVLRLTPFDISDLTILMWRGRQGLAFRYFPQCEPPLWAAYEITRQDESPKPTHWGLVTTDNGSYARSTAGTFDLRHQDGQMVLARGGIVLMSAPLSAPPFELFVSGQFRLRGLTMHRSASLPPRIADYRRLIVDEQASKLPWADSTTEVIRRDSLDDGGISFTILSNDQEGFTALPFNRLQNVEAAAVTSGLCEVTIQLQSADLGTGFFLGDAEGRPLYRWEFTGRAENDFLSLRPRRTGANASPVDFELRNGPSPILSQSVWLRWTPGIDRIRLQASGDGKHWGRFVGDLEREHLGLIGSFGLFGSPGQHARTLRVSRFQIHELTGFSSLAREDLRSRLEPPTVDMDIDSSEWIRRIESVRPEGVDPVQWFTANALKLLGRGLSKDLGRTVLGQLLDSAINSEITVAQKFNLLDAACLISDLTDERSAAVMAGRYEALGRKMLEAGISDPSVRVRQSILQSAAWAKHPFRSVWEQLQSHEILCAVYDREWSAAWSSARSASFWTTLPHPDAHLTERGLELSRHARWAESLVTEFAPQFDDGTAGPMPPNLRHPLVMTVNNGAYNARADLTSALSGAAFDDACRITMAFRSDEGQDLLPDSEDSELYLSFATILRKARKAFPEFARIMTDRYQSNGSVRLRMAVVQNDAKIIRDIALQFLGTEAARDAQVWFGDRELATGQFEFAEQRFLDAIADIDGNAVDAVKPRLILAKAMAGQLPGSNVPAALEGLDGSTIEFNSFTVSGVEFRELVQELLSRPGRHGLETHEEQPVAIRLNPGPFQLSFRAEVDGDFGTDSGRWEYRFGDAVARQLAVATDEQRMYVSNRFQVSAFSKSGTESIWTSGLEQEQADTYALPFTPMRPLVTGDRLFVRRLTKAGAELACLKTENGEVVWRHQSSHGLLTDPVIWNGKLFALVATKGDDDLLQVAATWFDDKTGSIVSRCLLFNLREPPERWYSGQLAINDRLAVATVAGTSICFDWKGEARWLKRHLLLRKPVDELADDFRIYPPVMTDQQVIISMPGVREIRCLDLSSGQTIWNRPIPDLRGILGVTDAEIVVDTPRRLMGISRDHGKVIWTYPATSRLEALWISGTTCVFAHRTAPSGGHSAPMLTWLNVQSGHAVAQTPLHVEQSEELLVGPVFTSGGKFFTFVGKSWKSSKRELHELLPADTKSTELRVKDQ